MTQAAARQISDVYKLAPTTADQTIVTAIYTDIPVWNAVTYRVTNEGANNVLFRDDGSAAVMPTVGTPQKGYLAPANSVTVFEAAPNATFHYIADGAASVVFIQAFSGE
jgi:hypothetical protein